MDDLAAKEIAHRVMIKTGQRHAGHIPYTTDHCLDLSKNWSPRYVPLEKFIVKLKEYVKIHLDMYHDMGIPLKKVIIISAHGGNDDMVKYKDEIKRDLGLEKLHILTAEAAKSQINRIIVGIEALAAKNAKEGEDPDDLAFLYTQILTTAGHADHFEHSMAAAIGVIDWEKLAVMNKELETNFDAALKKWPVLGGLSGYLQKGNEFTDIMGTKDNDKYGLWNAFRGLKELDHGKIVVKKEVGEMLINMIVEYCMELMAKE
jgi:creatinine amidohydrolase/Fe(II)-dependent formamide hydrolase-like protein